MGKKITSEGRLVFFLIFSSLLLAFFDRRGWIKPLRNFGEKPFLWAEKKVYFLSRFSQQFLVYFSSKKKLAEEKEKLEEKLKNLAVEQNQLSSCLEENEKMRRLLGAPLPANWKFLPAKVVGISGKMRIDKGEKDKVEEGMMVVAENILVGKISQVMAESSLVDLPKSPGVKIPVIVRRPGGKGIQARGLLLNFGENLLLDRVLQKEDIQAGDLVVTSGEDWLADLLVGQIEEVLPKSAEIYQKAKVKPLFDYDQLQTVFVVTKWQ